MVVSFTLYPVALAQRESNRSLLKPILLMSCRPSFLLMRTHQTVKPEHATVSCLPFLIGTECTTHDVLPTMLTMLIYDMLDDASDTIVLFRSSVVPEQHLAELHFNFYLC